MLLGSQFFSTRPAQAQAVFPWPAQSAGVERMPTVQASASEPIQVILPPVSARNVCPSDLAPAIDRIINQPSYRTAKWGIQIESLDQQSVLYSHNADAFLIPASNTKLFTTAAALQAVANRLKSKWKDFDSELKIVNQNSDNEYADDLLYRIGGVPTVKAQMSNLGIPPQAFRQVDGSGLSRQNSTTPATLVTLLKAMRDHPESEQFYRSLPISGVSGTLKNRFTGTLVQGLVHAKTGTLTGVRALSGYLEHPVYGSMVFSILVNQADRGESLRQGIDEIVTTVGHLRSCP
ncbi:MAG: hypothetical protein HC771_00495 [Synechococcales cyanobacterium CRU_2_2]|nr:hypothetical protein [Synechococcales cyanobacterium CRU_2_2]